MAGLGENVTDAEVDELIGTVDAEDKISCELSFRLGVRDVMESELTMIFFSQRICSVCEEQGG
jgi:hypothetical protein